MEFQPDQVGLKDVGREAGVSHSLITHYFGTYAGMIEAVLERRIRLLREKMMLRLRESGALARPGELLSSLFQALQDPIHVRLTRWLMASERPAADHAFALRDRGLHLIAIQVAEAIDPRAGAELVSKIEIGLVTAVAAAYGFALGKYALAASVGRQVGNELDADVQQALAMMLEAYLRSVTGLRP